MQHTIDIVVARDLETCKEEGDEPEEIELHTFSLSKIFELAIEKEFREAPTIAALNLVRDWLAVQNDS